MIYLSLQLIILQLVYSLIPLVQILLERLTVWSVPLLDLELVS